MSIVDTYFRWVTKVYIPYKGGYIVGTLKFSGTHYKRIFWNMRLFADSSDWKKQTEVTDSYLYVGSKEYLHPWKQVNPKVGKNDFRNSKGANRHLRKSSDKICRLNQKVKITSWTIYHFRCRFSRLPILESLTRLPFWECACIIRFRFKKIP